MVRPIPGTTQEGKASTIGLLIRELREITWEKARPHTSLAMPSRFPQQIRPKSALGPDLDSWMSVCFGMEGGSSSSDQSPNPKLAK